jgi:cation transport regulator ChaC
VTRESLWYFAYGSNMQRATFVERRGMQPQRSVWGRLPGYHLAFNLPVGPGERGVANIEANAAATTYGVLHLITADEFDRLDSTEGVGNGYYRRLSVDVIDRDGATRNSWTYVSSHGVAGRKPSLRYLGLLLEGALEHEMPEDYLRELRAFELAVDERIST